MHTNLPTLAMKAFPSRINLTRSAGSTAMCAPRYSTMGNTIRFSLAKVVTSSTSARLAGIGLRLVNAEERPVYLKKGKYC